MLKDIRTLDSKELHDEVVAMGENRLGLSSWKIGYGLNRQDHLRK